MRTLALPLLIAATAYCGAARGDDAVPATLRACGDSGEFPPYTYFAREAGRPTTKVAGFNADFLPQLLAPGGRSVEITLLPWKRCLALTQQGEFDFVLDAAATPARKQQFRLTRPFAVTHSVLLYDERRPVPVPQDTAALAKLHRCEVLGWDTSRASGAAGKDNQSYPSTMAMSFSMLTAGRCEALVSQTEVLRSLPLIGGGNWTRGMAQRRLPYLPESTVQYGVSRAKPYSAALEVLLNDGIARMEQSGESRRILARHLPPEPEVPKSLRACGDAAGFAPYTFAVNGAAQGYSVDYLQSVLTHSGRKVNVTLLPWKRCLLLAAQGDYDLILDASSVPERRKDFLLTQPHYRVTPVFVFRADRAPKPPANKGELANMRRCQVAGWNYALSGTTDRPELIITGSNVPAVFSMLRHNRCDILLFQQELLGAMESSPGKSASADLGVRPVPWAPAAQMHFGVSRAVPYAQSLSDLLDAGILRSEKAGEAARLLKRHVPRQ